MKATFQAFRSRCAHLAEKQGFPIIVTVCVCIITATALWTPKRDVQPSTPQVPTADISAAQLQQQSLKEVSTPPPSTKPPQSVTAPLSEYSLLTAFSTTVMRCSSITGIWSIHDAADLQAPLGTVVRAITNGIVMDCGQDRLQGTWVLIDHGDGVEALYAGIENDCNCAIGDELRTGDIIGYIGNGPLAESHLPPHLHLRTTKDGTAIDPLSLWESH